MEMKPVRVIRGSQLAQLRDDAKRLPWAIGMSCIIFASAEESHGHRSDVRANMELLLDAEDR